MSVENIGELLAEVTRSGVVESVHTGHIVMLNSDGSIHLTRGNPDLLVYPRSAIKSIQAAAMVRGGLDLEPRLLALVCSSHSGSDLHMDAVREILAKAGLDESALQNAFGYPLGVAERAAWGSKPETRIAMNCSGKHAGMLLTCVTAGWPIENYLDHDHPLQVAAREELELLAGEKVTVTSTDGCGAPLFLISMMGMARAIRAITISTNPIHQNIVDACRTYPVMVAGIGRPPTVAMQKIPGLFTKDGAEAVEVISLADGRTLVIKIADGNNRAIPTIVHAALADFGIDYPYEPIKIMGGPNVVGTIRATIN
jgi:L-asparaginase II